MESPPRRLSRGERVGLFVHPQLDRRLSRLGVRLMRRTRGSLANRYRVHALVLSTVGRKSGRPRDVVLRYFPDGEALVVVATNDGAATDPPSYLNVMAGGCAEVEITGLRAAVVPVRLEGEEAAAQWRRVLDLSPDDERHALVTDREFPVVRLVHAV